MQASNTCPTEPAARPGKAVRQVLSGLPNSKQHVNLGVVSREPERRAVRLSKKRRMMSKD
jgi:hypothetical protein